MQTPYGVAVVEDCVSCDVRAKAKFCHMEAGALQSLNAIRYSTTYPKGAILFVEEQTNRGVYIVCSGRVKLSVCSVDAKVLITDIAEAGEVLGLGAAISGHPYEATAETITPAQISFIRREDFLHFLMTHGEASLRAMESLSRSYHTACEKARLLGLSSSAAGKFASLLLECCARHGKPTALGTSLILTLTHEELGQMIGASRETITRLFGEFKQKNLIQVKGATVTVLDKQALEALAV